ncbi:probable G-protein coupled receptor 174 [Amia ocellicauda]|uniref:probable G-protein coupled receptor 174 n=1 Tax=Amia ocellicauda TaxID=2972642 RepID=UPI00346407DA|nr:GP174 protein [Amia calva]
MNDTIHCNTTDLQKYLHFIYAVTYTVILVPGLIGNVLALWVFYAYVKETKKAVIFMINLAIADLAQVLSLPLRIYYYLNHSWPFGEFLCMFCFYLKYVNMYASIFFLACISVRRCMFIIYPLRFSATKRRFDLYLSVGGWFIVCVSCLPFPLLRQRDSNTLPMNTCFSELPLVPLSPAAGITMMSLAELMGFLVPLALVLTCSWKTAACLREKNCVLQDSGEKHKAFKMVLSCALVFLICFAPYHITFPFDFLAKSNKVGNCTFHRAILKGHPITLCLASLNCCLDPIMYYFTTDEFKRRLSRQDIPESFQLHRKFSCTNGEEEKPL